MPPQSSAAAEDRPLHVFIVPGSWHTLDHCTPLIQALESHSIPASAAELPTCQLSRCNIKDFQHPDLAGPRPEKPWPDMYADAAAVHASLQGLVDAGKEVILVAHSYGGMPAAEALTPDLCVEQRTARGEPGGVIGFFGMVTFFLPKGMTTTQAVGGRMPQTPEQVCPLRYRVFSLVRRRMPNHTSQPGFPLGHPLDETNRKSFRIPISSSSP